MIANTTVLEPARLAAIEAAARRIHERIDFRTPPFPFEEFFNSDPTFKVFEVELPFGFDGRLLVTPEGNKLIHLRNENPRPRIRFTLAHEIIHAEMHLVEGKLLDNQACRTSDILRDRTRSVEEREADYGAAALLMPLWMLREHAPRCRGADTPEQVVRRLARLFRVSERTMRIQLALLDEQARAGAC